MSKNIWFSLYSIDEWPSDSRLPRSKWKNPDVTEYDHDRLVRIVNKCLPHQVLLNVSTKARFIKMNNWCEENFERRFCLWDNRIHCQSEQDAFAFKMRWI